MPLLLLPLAVLAFVTLMMLLLPWSIFQRYRAGTARRLARGWVALLNVFGIGFSAGLFLTTAAIGSVWIPGALAYSVSGLGVGGALGLFGLVLTRWEKSRDGLHYTPNRWLVLSIVLAVALRLCFGLWRGWRAWHASPHDESWLAASGFAGSMSAGALVLGYYLAFWIGVWIRVRNHRPQPWP